MSGNPGVRAPPSESFAAAAEDRCTYVQRACAFVQESANIADLGGASAPMEENMVHSNEPLVFVIQNQNDRFDPMPFSVALSWKRDQNADLALYVMYDAVELLKKEAVAQQDDIRESLDGLLAAGVPIFACGFCSRACSLSTESYYPGIQVANRQIFHSLMSERRALYW